MRTGIPGGASPLEKAESLARAARADEEDRDEASSLGAREGMEAAQPANRPSPEPASNGDAIERYDDLEPEEVVALLGSMERDDLLALRDHERAAAARPRILAAIDGVLARREAAQRG